MPQSHVYSWQEGPTKDIAYSSHLEAIKKCLGSVRMSSAARSYRERGSGAWMAELGDASDGVTSHIKWWHLQVFPRCYCTSLAWPALWTMAGFPL